MSLRDVSDPEFPPGLAMRPSAEQDQIRAYNYNRFSLNGMPLINYGPQRSLTLSPTQPSSPRSFGIQDQDYGITHSDANTNAWPFPLSTNSRIPHLPLQLQQPNPPSSSHPPSSPPNSGPAGFQDFDNSRGSLYLRSTYKDRDPPPFRAPQTSGNPSSQFVYSSSSATPPSSTSPLTRSTLWWGELEPWMDEEYAKQVCGLMGWDPVSIKVPHPPPDSPAGQPANNPGYCFLTFPTPAHAASVLSQINSNGSGTPHSMPNSKKPFLLNWASSTPIPPSISPSGFSAQSQQHAKEYSIFVGDLAPEASNSDLVAVFRNPVLGLRNDREPKFIKPFSSCKSAKIMLDPVAGVSRGYGFVRCAPILVKAPTSLTQLHRFSDEADQQRALIEMHGLYCLSRPSLYILFIAPIRAPYYSPKQCVYHLQPPSTRPPLPRIFRKFRSRPQVPPKLQRWLFRCQPLHPPRAFLPRSRVLMPRLRALRTLLAAPGCPLQAHRPQSLRHL